MPTMKTKVFRVRAVLGLPRADALLIAFALLVIQKMTNNPSFPSAGTLLKVLADAVTTFQQAVQNMGTTKAAAEARTSAKQAVIDALNHIKDHINGVAEGLPPDQAKAAVESAGLRCRKRATRIKLPLEVSYGGLPGSVVIAARAAGKSAMYFFEYSTDQKAWIACPFVMKCKTTISGLATGAVYYFRFRAQTNKGLGDYSDIVGFLVR